MLISLKIDKKNIKNFENIFHSEAFLDVNNGVRMLQVNHSSRGATNVCLSFLITIFHLGGKLVAFGSCLNFVDYTRY